MPDVRAVRDQVLQAAATVLGRRPVVGPAELGRWGSIRTTSPDVHIVTVERAKRIEVMQLGLVRVDNRDVLQLDYSARGALQSWGRPAQTVDRAVVLWSHTWMGYFHWLIDILPKLVLLQQTCPEELQSATLCFPHRGCVPHIVAESLDLLGLGELPRWDTGRGAVRAGRAIGVTLPGFYRLPPALAELRQKLGQLGPAGPQRIYLRRAGVRRVANEEEILPVLRRHGVSVVPDQPRSLVTQIGLFREAELVVAPHGGGLSNLLWCRPGTPVVELFDSGYQPPYFQQLAKWGGLRYEAVVCGNSASHWRNSGRDMVVSPDRLEERLSALSPGG